jgi:Tfp pilus assembly protein PilN
MIIWEDTTRDKLTKIDNNIVAVQADINSEKFVDLRKKIYELNKKSELILPIVEKRADLVEIVNAARKEVPEGVKVDSISLSEDNILTLSGISIDFRTIGKMMQKFTDSEDFSDFEVASINRVDKESNLIGGVRFQFELRLKQKILRPESATPLI